MPLQAQILLFLSAGALCCDLFLQKVPNLWIFLGILLGFSYQIVQNDFFGLLFSLKNFFLPILIVFSNISTVSFSRNGGWRFETTWYTWHFS